MSEIVSELTAAYDKVKEWPENSETGFIDLLVLRNLVPKAIAELDRLREENERLRVELNEREEAIIYRAAEDELRQHWASFCDADHFPNSDTFADRMEAKGLIELVAVTKDALQDVFAAERGIEPGGMMYRLTTAGRAALSPDNSTQKKEG